MWLIGRLVPDHKTVADFRKDNGPAIRQVCTRFVGLCREIGLLSSGSVAIDGSKFKAVNNRDRNFTRAKMARRRAPGAIVLVYDRSPAPQRPLESYRPLLASASSLRDSVFVAVRRPSQAPASRRR
jgi:hypothetical protein